MIEYGKTIHAPAATNAIASVRLTVARKPNIRQRVVAGSDRFHRETTQNSGSTASGGRVTTGIDQLRQDRFQSRRARAEVLTMSLSPRRLRQRVLENRKILARLEGRTNPKPHRPAALVDPHACGFAAALPPEGEQFAPWDGPAALMASSVAT